MQGYSGDTWLADFIFRETWNMNVGNYFSWRVTREEPELLTNIHDFAPLFYVVLSWECLESSIESDLGMRFELAICESTVV